VLPILKTLLPSLFNGWAKPPVIWYGRKTRSAAAALPVPPSSSVTVTVTVYVPAA
jgi:hypothetical protein